MYAGCQDYTLYETPRIHVHVHVGPGVMLPLAASHPSSIFVPVTLVLEKCAKELDIRNCSQDALSVPLFLCLGVFLYSPCLWASGAKTSRGWFR